ncbi:1,2-phenylacetyl-CoA epoxidase subunit PaaE [Microbacterium sp. NPDC096154]|uniref:1,2-phenylacetyl-CoA epoxidase subunit PaaE n=1 Tax=Microbacterium sp. NPDC096154 TaxID=3155549 RepID=UPI003316B868
MAATNIGAPAKKRASFHTLRVQDVRPLTPTSVEVTFEVPPELENEYRYLPGQYLALRAHIEGQEVRRSYSICRPPSPGRISVAVKRDDHGLFSPWVHTALAPGDQLDVMSPQGTFTSNLDELEGRHVVGIAAGSGITPVITMAHRILEGSATGRFTLLYTNRSSLDVMFVEELADLKDRFPDRLALHHVLSREQRTAPVLSGRLDEQKLRTILTSLIPVHTVDEWALCGPFELVQLCRDLLDQFGVDPQHVRFELFTTGEPGEAAPPRGRPVQIEAGEKTYRIDFTLDGTSASVESPVSANESILNAALRVRSDVPFACAGGVCGTCRARVLDGSVSMGENYALEPDEIERGYVLTCQSHPTSDRVVVDYDV